MKRTPALSAPTLCRNWLDALADAARAIGEWEDDERFWLRLASLAFTSALIVRRRIPETVEGDWLPPADTTESYALGHIRESVAASLRAVPGFPTPLRQGFTQGAASVPRAFAPVETLNDRQARGRWLVGLAMRLAFDPEPLVPDQDSRLTWCFRELPPSNLFLVSRLVSWRVCEVPDATVFGPVPEFAGWTFRSSGAEARIISQLVLSFEELGTSTKPIWNPELWMKAGWKAASAVVAHGWHREILETAPAEAIGYTLHLYKVLEPDFSSNPTFETLAASTGGYLRGLGYGRSVPGENANRCVRAFDYALWMHIGHMGLLQIPPRKGPNK